MDALGHSRRIRAGADVVEQDGELVATDARERIAGAQAVLEPARGRDQELVAGLVPEAVIDRLETIEVEVENRELRIARGAPAPLKPVLQPVRGTARGSADR